VTDIAQAEDDLITYREFMAALRSLKGAPGEYQENCNQNGGKSNKEAKCPVHMDKKCPYLSLY